MNRSGRATVVATVTGLGLTAFAPAVAGWSRPRSLEVKGYQGTSDTSVARAGGWTVTAWTAAHNDPDHPFVIRVRAMRPGGGLTRVRTVSPAGTDPGLPAVDVDGHGRGLVAWASSTNDGGWAVFERRLHGVHLGTVRRLTKPDDDTSISDWLPQVTIGDGGRTLVTWDHERTARPTLVQGRFVTARGHVGALRTFHESLGWNPEAVVACPDGSFVVGSRIHGRDLVLQRISRRGRTTHRNATTDLPGRVFEAEISCDGSSDVRALVNLRRGGSVPRTSAHLRTWRPSGSLSPARRATPRGQLPVSVGLATDGGGGSVVGWYEQLGSYAYRLHIRSVSGTARFGRVHDLGRVHTTATNGLDLPPAVTVAVDRTGRGAIVWSRLMKDGDDFATYGRAIRPGGALGRRTLLARYARFGRVDAPARGRAAVVYTMSRGRYDVRLRLAP